MNSWQYRYDTGWINRSDWTNVHLGSNTTLNTDSNVTHNLNAPLSNLLVKLMISTDGTDANSFEIPNAPLTINAAADRQLGWVIWQMGLNDIKIQTGDYGLNYPSDAGTELRIDTENWYYKVKVWFVG